MEADRYSDSGSGHPEEPQRRSPSLCPRRRARRPRRQHRRRGQRGRQPRAPRP